MKKIVFLAFVVVVVTVLGHCKADSINKAKHGSFPSLLAVKDFDLARTARHAISYEYTGGRFGDRVLGYAHARYLSYATGLLFLRRSFIHSEYLTIEYESDSFDAKISEYCEVYHINSPDTLAEFFQKIQSPDTPPTVFIVDYFPSDISEWDSDSGWKTALVIPWQEEKFAAYLRSSLQPNIPIPDLTVKGRLNVADHIRDLSGPDTDDPVRRVYPLKMPYLDYHERQIRRIYEWNGRRPMHVFLFSDTKTPLEFLQQIKDRFPNEDILFNIQALESPDLNHVVQDFFAMQKFDVLITTQSNFSMMASRLADFDMIISPVHAIGAYPHSQVDRVQLITRKSDWFPFQLNTILRETLPKISS